MGLLTVLVATVAVASASAAVPKPLISSSNTGAGAARTVFITFQTPSKNIGCGFTDQPSFLRCDINSGLKPNPAKPNSCQQDFGFAVGVKPSGKAYFLCVGDTVRNPTARVLQYGTTWRRSGITCSSSKVGLRCTNQSKHGFFLSRGHSKLF